MSFPRLHLEKETPTDAPIIDLIARRWSPVVYADDPVEPEKLASLFEAARWAPSCYNEQPWSFVIGKKGTPAWDGIFSTLVEPNQAWAQHAPILGISVAHLNFERNGKPNRHAHHDVGLAMGQLIIQAVELGLIVHQMAGFSVDKAREVLNLTEGYDPVAAFAIGYEGDPATAPEALQGRDGAPRQRKKVADFLFAGTWESQWT